MPSPRVTIATQVKPRFFRSDRRLYRRSSSHAPIIPSLFVATLQEAAQSAHALKHLFPLRGRRRAQRSGERMHFQRRPGLAQKLPDRIPDHEFVQPSIRLVRLPFYQSLFLQPVDDALDRPLSQTQLLAQILQAEPLGFHQHPHRALLRPGQAAALDHRLNGPVDDLPHGPQITVEFPHQVGKLQVSHSAINRRARRLVYDTSYTTYILRDAARCQGCSPPDTVSTNVPLLPVPSGLAPPPLPPLRRSSAALIFAGQP